MDLDEALSRAVNVLDARTDNLCALVNIAGLDLTRDLAGLPFPKVLLRQQDLSHFNFSQCDLTGADLTEADLTRANLFSAKLEQTMIDIYYKAWLQKQGIHTSRVLWIRDSDKRILADCG